MATYQVTVGKPACPKDIIHREMKVDTYIYNYISKRVHTKGLRIFIPVPKKTNARKRHNDMLIRLMNHSLFNAIASRIYDILKDIS